MSQYEIHKALTQAVIDANLGLNIAHENSNFDPSGYNDAFIDVTTIPSPTESMGKAAFDSDESSGIYQISIYELSGKSVKRIIQTVDAIYSFFTYGKQISSGTTTVEILETSKSNGRNVNGWYVIDVSIEYSAYISRV